jgi:hypothetical protein
MFFIVGGDCGVYFGELVGEVTEAGKATLRNARHLRRYYVAGRTGDGSMFDLASRGIDMAGSSVSAVVAGDSILLGVRRVCPVSDAALATFVPR